jgi:Ni,Fe-hydrogenase maturation factor
MARISNLVSYNDVRRNDSFYPKNDDVVKFTNSRGDEIVINPVELKEELHNFIDKELLSQTQENIEQKKDNIKTEIDRRLSEFERTLTKHVEDKLTKISETIIESVLGRVVEDKVNEKVKLKIKEIKKILE